MTLPGATPNPCDTCPWARSSMRGWLGPFTATQWVKIVHSDEPIACHQTIQVAGSWDGAFQCRGAAIFRENVLKLPRDHEVITGPKDETRVFSTNAEFMSHHAVGNGPALRNTFEDYDDEDWGDA